MTIIKNTLIVYFTVSFSLLVSANVKLPTVISDNMVLQRETNVPIWGWANPGEKVSVKFNGQILNAIADKKGKWLVKLSPMKVSFTPTKMTVKGKNTIILNNILVGDVWICSGQSNMEMAVGRAQDAREEIKNADYPSIRLFKAPLVSSFTPRKDIDSSLAKWAECSPRSIPNFSAVGYFFGRDIFKNIKAPIGLIQSAWGGTPAIAWTSQESTGEFGSMVADFNKRRLKREKELGFIVGDNEKMQDWTATRIEYARKKEKLPKRLYDAQGIYRRIPSNLYNGMIAPIIPFAICGVIWYQGEDDVYRAYLYRKLFRNLIQDWRKNWGQGNFPFYYIQLANWNSPLTLSYAELRESQFIVSDEPNVGMAVTVDIGNSDNVHYKNKQEAGRRLALIALAKTYGRNLVYSGPTFESMKVENEKAILKFKNVYGGLIAKGGKLEGFVIAGKKLEYEQIERYKGSGKYVKIRKFYPASAKIEGNTVVVWSNKVKEPAAIRYAWANSPQSNLYNKAGLPAVPFRTDNWRLLTQ